MKENLELIASKEFENYEEMYKVVDFFNKALHETDIVIGLSLKNDKQLINVYKEVK